MKLSPLPQFYDVYVLTNTKMLVWTGSDAISVQGGVTVVPGQAAQWCASQREWYLISPSPNRGRGWQTNGFAVSRMFSGGAGWAEIQRRCLCVSASAKHNKTLWGMNQTQSDRDTKAHMLIHSVNFTISLPLSPSLFYTLPISLSDFLINWPSHSCRLWWAYHYVFWLCRSVEFSWLLPGLWCQPSAVSDSHKPDHSGLF